MDNELNEPQGYVQNVQCDTSEWTRPCKCAVNICSNVFTNAKVNPTLYKFHSFPQRESLCNVWREKCNLVKDCDFNDLKVCTDHFIRSDYMKREENTGFPLKLLECAIPHKKLDTPPTFIDDANIETPHYSNIKEAMNEDALLETKLRSVENDTEELLNKIHLMNQKIAKKKKDLVKVTRKLVHYKKKPQRELSCLRKVFSETQINLLRGKKTQWTDDDLAMAFTLRQIGSKKCYLYLKNTLNWPLPALSCVQKWAAYYNDD